MKAIIQTLRNTRSIVANDTIFVSREVFKFTNTNDGLWSGAKRYIY